MIELVLILAAGAVIGAAAVRWLRTVRRGSAPIARRSTREPRHPWLESAGAVAQAGRQLADDIEPILHSGAIDSSEHSVADPLTSQLDDFTQQVARLATGAPTTMDERVCRSVALRSHGLSEALRASNEGSGQIGMREVRERYSEFGSALRDLEQHVHLL